MASSITDRLLWVKALYLTHTGIEKRLVDFRHYTTALI